MLPEISKVFGLAGTSVIILAILISAVRYCGRQGERYSLLNHFISELGEVDVSPAARVFNRGLTIGGVLLLPFMVGLGIAFQNLWGWIGMVAGVIASLGVAAVGLYPMNDLTPHMRAAITYFRSGLVMVIFFALAIFFQSAPVLPPAANLLSLLAALSYGAFLWLLRAPANRREESSDGQGSPLNPQAVPERPRVAWAALLEWSLFFTTVAWIFGIAALG